MIASNEHMSISLVALQYSRPAQRLFTQATRAGRVHSSFLRAMNIAIDNTLLSLISEGLPHMPNGVRISSATMEKLRERVVYDMEVWIGDGQLTVPACHLSLALPDVPAWEPHPAVEHCQWDRAVVMQHAHMLALYLAEHTHPASFASLVRPLMLKTPPVEQIPYYSILLSSLEALLYTTEDHVRFTIAGAIDKLLGLGPGFTPAGDDILCGFMAVMVLLSTYLGTGNTTVDCIAALIPQKAYTNTTLFSATLLDYAARGEVAEQLADLLLSLSLPLTDSKKVVQAAAHLLSFGATSGADTLLGVLLGLHNLAGMGETPPIAHNNTTSVVYYI